MPDPTPARVGYEQAITTLLGVAERTGSPAARWAAEYLAADPDRSAPPKVLQQEGRDPQLSMEDR